MKKYRIPIIILVAVLLFGLILYHFPRRRQISMWTCTLSGESVQVEMNLKYYRRLFRAPYVKGTVLFDGVEYLDEDSMFKNFNVKDDDFDFTYNGPLPVNMEFCKTSATNIIEAGLNRILFFDISEGDPFEKIHFMYQDESMKDETGTIRGVSYFGPAQTVAEAQQIATYFGYSISPNP